MRIGIFTDDLYPESGGVSRSIQLQLQELAAAGHRVTLFAPAPHFKAPPECAWQRMPYWHLPGTPSFLGSLQVSVPLARRIAAEHRQLEVAHSQNERGSIFLAALVAKELGIPHVHTFHSNYAGTHRSSPGASALNSLTYLDWSGRSLRWLATAERAAPLGTAQVDPEPGEPALVSRDWRSLARLASAIDRFTSPADFLVNGVVAASGGALAERGHVVASGVSEAFRRAHRKRTRGSVTRFLSAGRLGAEKRVDVLLDAFEALGRDDAELRIIGTGAAMRSLRRRAARIAHGTVRFLGHFTDADLLAQELADADVFVLASYRFDTQAMVLAEAAATGTPILYCDDRLTIGTGPENALLTGPSAAEMAAGMRELMNDRPRLQAMSAASAVLGRRLGSATMRQNYLSVYRDAVSAAGRPVELSETASHPRVRLTALGGESAQGADSATGSSATIT
jgi:glycosyltransferase involved in cell wall biosynthesis